MVNLKTYLLEATAGEERLSEVLGQLRKYAQLGDREFVGKFVAALRDIVHEKGVPARQKYLCLQVVNVGLQGRSPLVAEVVEEKLLERLFLLAMFEAKAEGAETRGRRLLKQFDEDADEEASADFYALLLECFAAWGREPLTAAFAAKHTMLAKSVALPGGQRHLLRFAEGAAAEREQPQSGAAEALQQVEARLQALERLGKQGGREAEARKALKELEQACSGLGDAQLRQRPVVRARELLERLEGREAGLLPALQGFFGSAKPNPFAASTDDPVPARRDPPAPEDIRALAAYVERERAHFLRKIASLEEENKKLFDERRKAEIRTLALEAEVSSRQNGMAALEEEVLGLRELGGGYLREGLEFFRQNAGGQRAPQPSTPFSDHSRYSGISQRRFAEERPRPTPPEESPLPSYLIDDHSARQTRLRGFYENPPHAREAAGAEHVDKARNLGDVSSLKGQFQYSADFVANFNADIANILNRKSSALAEPRAELDFPRRRDDNAFGLSQTLEIGRGRSRAQSSRLQEYVKKYSEGDGAMLDSGFRRQEEAVDYRPRPEAGRQAAGGILKYKNY